MPPDACNRDIYSSFPVLSEHVATSNIYHNLFYIYLAHADRFEHKFFRILTTLVFSVIVVIMLYIHGAAMC